MRELGSGQNLILKSSLIWSRPVINKTIYLKELDDFGQSLFPVWCELVLDLEKQRACGEKLRLRVVNTPSRAHHGP